jgi:CubicO group peptidase (beta-lactamase class C family)
MINRKKLSVLAIAWLICFNMNSQTKVNDVIANFTKFYNVTAYKQVYALLSSEAKKQLPEKEITNFLENQIYKNYGECINYRLVKSENTDFIYSYLFKEDSLQLTITLNSNSEIDGFTFVPFPKKAKPKREFYLSDNKKQSTLDTTIDRLVKPYMQNPDHNALCIGIIKNDSVYFYNYGEEKKDSKILPSQTSLFEIGSITKTFCGNLLAQAVSENKLKLDDDIRLYLKGNYKNLEFNKQPILVKHLANHTSGLPRQPENLFSQKEFDLKNPYSNYTNQSLLNYIKEFKLSVTPGTNCEYSNLGMGLLGIILENVYKQSFSDLVKQKICEPLKMTNTGVQNIKPVNILPGYENGTNVLNWQFKGMEAAGAIYSTPFDMMLYVKSNLQNTAQKQIEHSATFDSGKKIALAWHFIKRKTDAELIWHNGATGGFSSFIGLIKDKNTGFIVLTNSSAETDALPISIYNNLKK